MPKWGPCLKLLLFALLGVLSSQSANAQLAQVPTYEQLAVSLKAYQNRAWTAERAEFVGIQKGKNWNLVPSVGLAFGLPSVGFNTGQIASYKQRQGETAAKLKSLELRYTLLLNEQLNQVRIACEKLLNERVRLEILSSTNSTREKIYKIYLEAYEKKELKPVDWYSQKLSYLNSVQTYQLAVRDYNVQVLEVERLAHYNMPNEDIAYVDSELEGASSLLEVLPTKLPPGLLTKPSSIRKPISNPAEN